ncbi:MAG: tetratricopeptide repeat protein [Selenomonadaceae bacterium]|nr:tetratricopeptide repeat protein [Selenomonadaceae bacterium]
MKKFLTALLIVGNLFSASTVNAEIKIYEGVGEYLMSDFETFDVAQQRAKQRAEQSACEQAGVYVESRTEVVNAQVERDEILTMTSGILKIVDVQFKREFIDDNTTRVRAIIKAKIDSDDINKWLSKSFGERTSLVEQNEQLRRANAEQDKQIAELKKQLINVKTQQDRERITQRFAAEDKIFLSNKKYEEGLIPLQKGDYRRAEDLFTQAIELNPNNALAYGIRGTMHYNVKDYKRAIADFNRAVELDPNWIQMHLLIGYSYYGLNDYGMAIASLSKVINMAKNFSFDRKYGLTGHQLIATAYYNRGIIHKALGEYDKAQADFARARRFN